MTARILCVSFLLALCSELVHGQSAYLDTLRTTYSTNIAGAYTSDASSYGFGAAVTLKGAVNIGLSRIWSRTEIDFETETGTGFAGYFSAALANELRGDNLGAEFAILFETLEFDVDDFSSATINALGIGLGFSKQSMIDESYGDFLLRFSVVYFPVVQYTFEDSGSNGTTISDNFFTFSAGPAIVLRTQKPSTFVFEPSLSYATDSELVSVSMGISLIF